MFYKIREIIEETDIKNTIIIKMYDENGKGEERLFKRIFYY